MLSRTSLNAARRAALIQKPLIRAAATASLSQDESLALLQAQRRRRPNSPHLTIYKWQMTSVLSILNRATGAALSGGTRASGTLGVSNRCRLIRIRHSILGLTPHGLAS